MKKIDRFIKAYPWYGGFTGDLLFYIAVDTLFLTIVKNFSASQIVALSAFSQITCIALQLPALFVIKRIGNTASVRMGALFLLISSVLITFGTNFYFVLLGRVFHDIAAMFRTASFVALENNLELVDRRKDFVKLRAASNTVYSVLTMLISFVASYMFNLNHYLPMIGCITCCMIGFVLSFYIKDYSAYNKIEYKKKENAKVRYNKFIILTVAVYAIFYPVVNNGQTDGKLFMQQQIFLDFNVDDTALIIGVVVCVSRIIRVFSNVVFEKLYRKFQKKLGVALPIMICFAIAFILFGSFVGHIVTKIVIMAIGYTIILFARDPFKLYIQDVIFENTPKEQHQTLLTLLEFAVRVITASMALSFSAILLNHSMVTVMSIMLIASAVNIFLSLRLYKMIVIGMNNKKIQK